MNCSFEEYKESVLGQLECNADDDYKSKYVVYLYDNNDIENNLAYFRDCLTRGLSPYKALLFFRDYLDGEYRISDKGYNIVYEKK